MSRGKSVILRDGTSFKTQSECQTEIRRIRDAYPEGTNVPGRDGEVLRMIYERHPDVALAISSGRDIIHCGPILNKIPQKKATKGIQVIVTGNIDLRPGMDVAVTGQHKPHRTQVITAARDLVQAHMNAFKIKQFVKSSNGAVQCALTGVFINNPSEMDVDHVNIEFLSLWEAFLRVKDIWYDNLSVTYVDPESPVSLLKFTDEVVNKEWVDFHNKIVNPQLVEHKAHKAKAKTKRSRINPQQLSLGFDDVA